MADKIMRRNMAIKQMGGIWFDPVTPLSDAAIIPNLQHPESIWSTTRGDAQCIESAGKIGRDTDSKPGNLRTSNACFTG